MAEPWPAMDRARAREFNHLDALGAMIPYTICDRPREACPAPTGVGIRVSLGRRAARICATVDLDQENY